MTGYYLCSCPSHQFLQFMLSKGYRRFLAKISKEFLSDFLEAHIPPALLDLMQPGGKEGMMVERLGTRSA